MGSETHAGRTRDLTHQSPNPRLLTDTALFQKGWTWLAKLRLRAAVAVIGIPLAFFGIFTVGLGWVALPVVGLTVAAVSVTMNKLGQRFDRVTCWTCGEDLAKEPAGVHGVICPCCGSLNQHNPRMFALGDEVDASELDA